MVPAFLRSSRALAVLNVVAVGVTLAAVTGFWCAHRYAAGHQSKVLFSFETIAIMSALPTLKFGVVWALALRWRREVGRLRLRVGWLLTPLLAVLSFSPDRHLLFDPAWWGAVALLAPPLLWSQQLVRRGLSGAERGEAVVGSVCAALAASVLLALTGRFTSPGLMTDAPWPYPLVGPRLLPWLGLLGLLSGSGAVGLAGWRGRQRRQLVVAAEAGERPDYRVEHTHRGRVLVRVRPAGADDYREADRDEDLFALDPLPSVAASAQLARSRPGHG